MPRVKQMAIVCDDAERLEKYYCRWFGFKKLGRGPGDSVYLTDGYLSVGFLKRGPDLPEESQELGLHHVGIREVEVNRGSVEAGKRSRGCVAGGFVNICLVRRETDPQGASHFGVIMRHPEHLVSKLREAYPARPELWQPDRPGVEVHIRDLEHNALSLSDKKGWEVDAGKWDRVEYEALP